MKIERVGDRIPRLYFVINEDDAPYYFKEDIIIPEGEFKRPPDPAPGESYNTKHRYQNIIYCAKNSAKIREGNSLKKRAAATYKMAELLGIKDIVARCEIGTLTFNGKEIPGTRMDAVKGATYSDLKMFPDAKGFRLYYTKNAVYQLTVLMMFDLICGQIDRHTKNIKYFTDRDLSKINSEKDNDKIFITGVCAIDHDLSFGELYYSDIKKRVSAGMCICPEFLGEMQYTAVDMEFFERLLTLKKDMLLSYFNDLLDEGEINALLDRLEGLKSAVYKEKEKEERLKKEGDSFFSRLIYDKSKYKEYLSRMEENAVLPKKKRDARFSYYPSYLRRLALTHEPLSGGE